MPELPEVETVVRELDKKLRGKIIKHVDIRTPKVIGVGPASLGTKRKASPQKACEFQRQVLGHRVLSVKRRAKLLFFNLTGPQTILVHLKMTGQFIFEDKKQRQKTQGQYRVLNKLTAPLVALPSKHTHVVFEFTDQSRLYYNDVRKFGYLRLVQDADILKVKELKSYGPEPLGRTFTLAIFKSRSASRPKQSIKQFLMDNAVVVGIGNIYSDEILFQAGVAPVRKLADLQAQEWVKIFQAIAPVLKQGIKAKGSSVGDFIRTDGTWGQMGKFHFVYGRKNQPCKKCGTMIIATKLGGRTSCYCPKCQA